MLISLKLCILVDILKMCMKVFGGHKLASDKITSRNLYSLFYNIICSKISLLRPPKIKTTSPLRPVFTSPKWPFPYDIIFDIKITSLIRPLLGSPKGGLRDFTVVSSGISTDL